MCQVTEMKSKLFLGPTLLAGIHFVVDHYDHKHSTAITAFRAIIYSVLILLWNAPPKNKEFGPEDEAEILRGGDGSHHRRTAQN